MAPRVLPEITEKNFDVIIIGAGINGAGIARDAALRGLTVLLLDKGDIGSGTSSSSTRLIHGGLRYLEHGELNLVRESLREREILMKIAPHLIKPLEFLIPCYQKGRRSIWTIRAGMIAYDLLSFNKSLPRHRMLSRREVLERVPGLNPIELRGGALYCDAQIEFAERLVLENALAAKGLGATVITYARVQRLLIENSNVKGVEFVDECDRQIYVAHSRCVVNASGPWVDQLLDVGAAAPRLIGGTKGSHIVVGAFPGAPHDALYVEAKTDARPFFIIPWNGNYLIGTTDIRYEGDLDNVQIDEQEIDYLLNETNSTIPTASLTRDAILYTYSGVRPLAYTRDNDEESITRRHFIRRHPQVRGLISIVGGKLTTYRTLAEDAVNLVMQTLGRPPAKCLTAVIPLPGARTEDLQAFSREFLKDERLPKRTLERLLRIYGTRSFDVLNLTQKDPALAEIFSRETGATAAELIYAFQHELAKTLADCLLRRTMVGLGASMGIGEVESAASICKRHLRWSNSRAADEVCAYRAIIKGRRAAL